MDRNEQRFFVKAGYQSRAQANYDSCQEEIEYQPLVQDFAVYLAERYGCRRIIDLGCGRCSRFVRTASKLDLTGVDSSGNIEWCRGQYPFGTWIEHDFERGALECLDPLAASQSVVVCVGAIERLIDPTYLLATIRGLLEDAPIAVLTTPERDLVRGRNDMGPPADRHRVREWNLLEFRHLIENAGLEVLFHGLTFDGGVERQKRTILSVVTKRQPSPVVPAGFRVVAIVGAYNEEDVIVPFLEHTIGQGMEVYLLDNWSTDRTVERATRFVQRGVKAIERFPESGPTSWHEWHAMLSRKAELSAQLEGDWFIHLDPDEIRESPWPGLTIREALYRVDREGFNAVDHTCVVFHPTTGQFRENLPIQAQFPYFEFGTRPGHFTQIKAWKRQPAPVQCAESGGHEVDFPGRRVYPFKFLLRHYPIRSQEHGERKVFSERLPRFTPGKRKRGWHIQYDGLSKDHCFVRDPATLSCFDPATFYAEYLMERLSGVGIVRPA